MIQFLINTISKIPSIETILTTVTGEGGSPVAVFGMPDTARAVLSVVTENALNKPIFVVTDTEAATRKMAADALSVGASAEVFPASDFNLLNGL